MSTAATRAHRPHTPIGRVLGLSIALAALLSVVVLAFAWPSVTAEPHNLPIAITGPEQAVTAVTTAVDETRPGVLAFDEVDDRDAAIAAPITGVVALIGRAGLAVGPIVMMLFANPISGAAMPREFLPGAWGQIGQWFPPGAAANLLRDVSYFPQADASFSWLVLGAWTVGGLFLSVLGHFRTAGGAESDDLAAHEDDAEPAAAVA